MSETAFWALLAIVLPLAVVFLLELVPVGSPIWQHVIFASGILCAICAITLIIWWFRDTCRRLGNAVAIRLRSLLGLELGPYKRLYPKTPYVAFPMPDAGQSLEFQLPFYNGMNAPIRISAVTGNIRYEGVAIFQGDTIDGEMCSFSPCDLRHGVQNPFNRNLWNPGELVTVFLTVSPERDVIRHMQACHSAGLALKFRLENLDIRVSPKGRENRLIRVPITNLIFCAKAPHGRTDVSEVNEARISATIS